MIRRFSPSRPSVRAHRAGFTLIELLTVIAIILVLAGLLINVAGSANYKGSFARAQTEVKAMETALESYKAENGAYPRTAYSDSNVKSDTLNAQSETEPTGANYKTSGRVLYQALAGYGTVPNSNPAVQNKKYMDFKPGQLSTGTAAADPTNTWVIDPFGFPYGYSTAYQAATESTPPPSPMPGYNPTFDLWSTGGYSASGKAYTKSGLATTAYNTLWAKNW